jgi:hypothetical protein
MAAFYELTWDIAEEHGIESLPEGVESRFFCTGAPLPALPPAPWHLRVGHTRAQPPRHMLVSALPVMSTQLVRCLREAGAANLETMTVVLDSISDGTRWTGFEAVNVVGLVGCADLQRSAFIEIMPRAGAAGMPLLEFDHLVIDPARAGSQPLFRLAEAPATLVVSAAVVHQLRATAKDAHWGITLFEIET